jgi:RNA polymerase sigma-70 factor (ECF subfamily)
LSHLRCSDAFTSDVDLARAPALDPDPETAAVQGNLEQIVQSELAQLPDKYRLPLLYAAIDGLDYDTIGAMIDVPAGTVKTLVFRARQMLKERMKAYGG